MHDRAIRALTLLLAFGLGGIALPIAHEVDHLLDARDTEVVEDGQLVDAEHEKFGHDCELCEVRVAATSGTDSFAAKLSAVDLASPEVPETVQTSSDRCFDGRAPPARA